MTKTKQLEESIKHKHILLDTCFIIKAHQYAETEFFDGLFSLLEKYECIPVINEFIKFEFLRGCQTREQIQTKTKFLEALSGFVMPIDKDVLDGAIDISNIYSNKRVDSKQISRVDCYLSSYLKKYPASLIMVTLNHPDYPLIIHDRFFVHTIDAGKEILTIGFYGFNTSNFEKCLQDIR